MLNKMCITALRLSTLLITLIFLTLPLTGQTPQDAAPSPTPPNVEDRSKPVTTTQGFIDDATQAFELLEAQRATLEKYKTFEARTEAERQSVDRVLKSLDDLIAVKDKTIVAVEKLTLIYQQMIDFQQKIITQLQNMLNKPKSFWQKLLNGIKEVVKALIYIGIGRGLVGELDRVKAGLMLAYADYSERLYERRQRNNLTGFARYGILLAG